MYIYSLKDTVYPTFPGMIHDISYVVVVWDAWFTFGVHSAINFYLVYRSELQVGEERVCNPNVNHSNSNWRMKLYMYTQVVPNLP